MKQVVIESMQISLQEITDLRDKEGIVAFYHGLDERVYVLLMDDETYLYYWSHLNFNDTGDTDLLRPFDDAIKHKMDLGFKVWYFEDQGEFLMWASGQSIKLGAQKLW